MMTIGSQEKPIYHKVRAESKWAKGNLADKTKVCQTPAPVADYRGPGYPASLFVARPAKTESSETVTGSIFGP
jgi:hypothetical protein